MKLAIFDDDSLHCDILARQLKPLGHRCEFLTPADGFPLNVDALIVDWLMCPSWGVFRDWLIQTALLRKLPVCIHTGGGVSRDVTVSLFGAEVPICHKKINNHELIAWLQKLQQSSVASKNKGLPV